MESEASARRRIQLIATHLSATSRDAVTHLVPMKCSSNQLSSVIRRGDSRMNFARQGSTSQAFFSRQVSLSPQQKSSSSELNSVIRRGDSRVNFARQGSNSQAFFMRQVGYGVGESEMPSKYPDPATQVSREASLYSRPPSIPNTNRGYHKHDCYLNMLEPPPAFARPSKTTSHHEKSYRHKTDNSQSSGTNSPATHVTESGSNYVIAVEIPGVNIDDIRVEIDDQNLSVTSKGSKLKLSGGSFPATYHRKDVLQGMHKLIWPLPSHVNKDHVTAEFWNGLLQIVIPKI